MNLPPVLNFVPVLDDAHARIDRVRARAAALGFTLAVLLPACGQTPVFADTLTPVQRARVEQIVADARKVNVQLDSALADQVGAHLGMLAAQTAADAAQKEAAALRAQVASVTTERDAARTERDALHASRWRWLGFGVVFGIILPYALRFGIRTGGLLAKYGWLAAV